MGQQAGCEHCRALGGRHYDDCPRGESFEEWFFVFQQLAATEEFQIHADDPDSYRDYFEDGDSPADALEAEQAAAEGGSN